MKARYNAERLECFNGASSAIRALLYYNAYFKLRDTNPISTLTGCSEQHPVLGNVVHFVLLFNSLALICLLVSGSETAVFLGSQLDLGLVRLGLARIGRRERW